MPQRSRYSCTNPISARLDSRLVVSKPTRRRTMSRLEMADPGTRVTLFASVHYAGAGWAAPGAGGPVSCDLSVATPIARPQVAEPHPAAPCDPLQRLPRPRTVAPLKAGPLPPPPPPRPPSLLH